MMDHPKFEPVVGFNARSDSLNNFERHVGSFKLTEDMSAILGTRGGESISSMLLIHQNLTLRLFMMDCLTTGTFYVKNHSESAFRKVKI